MIKAQLFISCPKKTNQLQFILGIFEIFKVKIGISPTIMTEILKFCDNATHNVRNDQVLERRHNRTTNFGVESTSTLGPKKLEIGTQATVLVDCLRFMCKTWVSFN